MALSIKSENSTRFAETITKSSKRAPKIPTYLEGLIGCAILVKLKTRSGDGFQRISERSVLSVIESLRSSQISVTDSGEFETIRLKVGRYIEKRRVTLKLSRGSIKALLATKPDQLREQLKAACKIVNSPSVEKKLLAVKEDIREHSHRILSAGDKADLVAQTQSILFA